MILKFRNIPIYLDEASSIYGNVSKSDRKYLAELSRISYSSKSSIQDCRVLDNNLRLKFSKGVI